MNPIGVAIVINKRRRLIGKVGIVPDRYETPEYIIGHKVFYREVPYKRAYSGITKTIGIDSAAADLAERYGAVYVVTYCKDKKAIYVAHISDLLKTYSLDLGEFTQYRLALKKWIKIKVSKGIDMGYTRQITLVAPTRESPQSGSELLGYAKQLSFFDL